MNPNYISDDDCDVYSIADTNDSIHAHVKAPISVTCSDDCKICKYLTLNKPTLFIEAYNTVLDRDGLDAGQSARAVVIMLRDASSDALPRGFTISPDDENNLRAHFQTDNKRMLLSTHLSILQCASAENTKLIDKIHAAKFFTDLSAPQSKQHTSLKNL